MPDFPDLGLASRSAAFNRVLIFIALGELCILVGIAAILAEPLAHLLTGQPCSARYPANLRPVAGRFMQEVEPILMLNATLLFARSDERRVVKACVCTFGSRWWLYKYKKK